MSDTPVGNGTVSYRLGAIERRLDRLEDTKPDVMRQELNDVKEDVRKIAQEMASMRRLLVGAIISGFTTIVSVALLITNAHP